jgi:hypothetical protein
MDRGADCMRRDRGTQRRHRAPPAHRAAHHDARRHPRHHSGPDADRPRPELADAAARAGDRRGRPAPARDPESPANRSDKGRQTGRCAQGRDRAPHVPRHAIGARARLPARRRQSRAAAPRHPDPLRRNASRLPLARDRPRRRSRRRTLPRERDPAAAGPKARPGAHPRRPDPDARHHWQVVREPVETTTLLVDVFTACQCRRGSASSKRAA